MSENADEIYRTLMQQQTRILTETTENARAILGIKEFLDSSPVLKRGNAYGVYTFPVTAVTTSPQPLFDCSKATLGMSEFGGFAPHSLYVDDPGTVNNVSFIRLNSPSAPRLTVQLGAAYNFFDIYRVFYEVTTLVQDGSPVRIALFGWVK